MVSNVTVAKAVVAAAAAAATVKKAIDDVWVCACGVPLWIATVGEIWATRKSDHYDDCNYCVGVCVREVNTLKGV